MELKPAKGIKVVVNAKREAIFGDEGVDIQKISLPNGNRTGMLTGMTLAGFCEVEMQGLDGRKHWYPIEELSGENGEKVVEEEIPLDMIEDDSQETEEEPA